MMALATIRRLLFELGRELLTESPRTLVGQLELWMHEPHAGLEGQGPLRALADAMAKRESRLG